MDQPQKLAPSVVMTPRWRLINGQELYDMSIDPGQQLNVARNHPEIVQKLLTKHDIFWEEAKLSTRKPAYPQLTRRGLILTCDVDVKGRPIKQQNIAEGQPSLGHWHMDVQEAGQYTFELRRWPREINAGILDSHAPVDIHPELYYANKNTPVRNFTPLPIAEAVLELSNRLPMRKEVSKKDTHITFKNNLQTGVILVKAHFFDKHSDLLTGAYYVYVSKSG